VRREGRGGVTKKGKPLFQLSGRGGKKNSECGRSERGREEKKTGGKKKKKGRAGLCVRGGGGGGRGGNSL